MTATYALSLSVGVLMVHTGNAFALRTQDAIVARAHRTDPRPIRSDWTPGPVELDAQAGYIPAACR